MQRISKESDWKLWNLLLSTRHKSLETFTLQHHAILTCNKIIRAIFVNKFLSFLYQLLHHDDAQIEQLQEQKSFVIHAMLSLFISSCWMPVSVVSVENDWQSSCCSCCDLTRPAPSKYFLASSVSNIFRQRISRHTLPCLRQQEGECWDNNQYWDKTHLLPIYSSHISDFAALTNINSSV